MMKTLTLFFLLLVASLGAVTSPLPSRHAITAGSLDLVLAANPINIETNVIVTTLPPMLLQWLAGDVTPADNTNYFASLTTNVGTWKVLGVLMPSAAASATNSVINNFFTSILTNINQITQITYGNTNVLVITVPNVAALKALPTGIGIGSVFVRGTATPGDGGARWAVWYPGDGRQDNNGTILRPNNELDNPGAFICDIDLYTGLHAIVFGAPVTNFVLQAAFNYATNVGYPNVILSTGSTLLDNTSPIDIPSGQLLTFENNAIVTFTDNTKTGFRFNGVTNAGIVGGAIQGASIGVLMVGTTNCELRNVTATNNTTPVQLSLNGSNKNAKTRLAGNDFGATGVTVDAGAVDVATFERWDFDSKRIGNSLDIAEIAAPSNLSGYGRLYPNVSDHHPHMIQNGTDYDLSLGIPPGSDTQMVFNDGGVFGASTNALIDKVSSLIILRADGASGAITIPLRLRDDRGDVQNGVGLQADTQATGSGSERALGNLLFSKQQIWTGTASTRNSYVDIQVSRNGSLESGFKYQPGTPNEVTMGPIKILSGNGIPEGNVIGSVGWIYLRTDGGTNTTIYIKEIGSGTTGWGAK